MSFKSFLDWLGSDENKNNSKTNLNSPVDWSEKRRDNRVDMDNDKQLVVHVMKEDESGVTRPLIAQVKNISVRGCGLFFEDGSVTKKIKEKDVLIVSLDVDESSIPLQVEVVRIVAEGQLAIRFKPPFPRELERLERFLEPRCLGRSIREIDKSKLQGNQKKDFRWFQGVNETHLFSWSDPLSGEIVQQQFVFLEHVVEWKSGHPAKTGSIRQEKDTFNAGLGWVKSELMDFDAIVDPVVIQQAKLILDSSGIETKIKEAFLKKIKYDK